MCWRFCCSAVCVPVWLWPHRLCVSLRRVGWSVCRRAVWVCLGVAGCFRALPWPCRGGCPVGRPLSCLLSGCFSCWSFPPPVLVRLCSCSGSCSHLGRCFGWPLVSGCLLPPWPWLCSFLARWLLLVAACWHTVSCPPPGCCPCWCPSVWLLCWSLPSVPCVLPVVSLGAGSVGLCVTSLVCPARFGGLAAELAGVVFTFPLPRGVVMSSSALVGFSGSRSLSGSHRGLVLDLISSILRSGRGVAVGCAPGLDAMVRAACPGAEVFRVAGSGRGDFAARSVACVQAVASSGIGSGWVSFPGSACPDGLVPSCHSSLCFCGTGSGSWASAAYAVGLGLPLVVFGLNRSLLPSWGTWVCAGSGPWAHGFRLSVPARPQQLSLI